MCHDKCHFVLICYDVCFCFLSLRLLSTLSPSSFDRSQLSAILIKAINAINNMASVNVLKSGDDACWSKMKVANAMAKAESVMPRPLFICIKIAPSVLASRISCAGTSANAMVFNKVKCIERVTPLINSMIPMVSDDVFFVIRASAINPAAISMPLTINTRLKPNVFIIQVVAGFIARFPANSQSSSEPASTGV